MKKLKISSVLIGAALLTASSALASYDGTLTAQAGPNGDASGFNVTTTGIISGTFYTFCLEGNETISTPTPPAQSSTYYYNVNSGAVNGGISYSPTPGASPTFDPLSIGTAWLYSQFASGGIANTAANDLNLQWAIWYLEGEKFSISDIGFSGADATAFLNAAVAALGGYGVSSISDLFNNANGAFGVVALNDYTSTGGNAQDVLAIVPEPSTIAAGVLLLLPFGVSTLRILRKKQTA